MSVDLEMVKLQDTKKSGAPGVQPSVSGLELHTGDKYRGDMFM